MGFEDKTTYVYAFTADKTPTLLSHLVSSLAAHDYSIEDAEADRTATIEHEGTSYTLPIYAISKRFYSGDDDAQGYRSEKDLKFELKPKAPTIKFNSGVWCKPDSLLDEDRADRHATKGKKNFHLTHFVVKLDVASRYVRLKIDIWGDQYWGGVQKDPSFAKLTKPLKELCEIMILETDIGPDCVKPKMKSAARAQFEEYYQDNDYFEKTNPDQYSKAILEFQPEED